MFHLALRLAVGGEHSVRDCLGVLGLTGRTACCLFENFRGRIQLQVPEIQMRRTT